MSDFDFDFRSVLPHYCTFPIRISFLRLQMIYKGCLSTEYVNFGAESIEDTLSSEDYMKMALDRVGLKERVPLLIG